MDHCPTTDDSHIRNSGPGPLSRWTSEYLHWEVPLRVKLTVPQTPLYRLPSQESALPLVFSTGDLLTP